jgi:hypothetical protein
MSTSVIHPGTTPKVGRSGRFLGLAAVGLAAVIALGFVFAVNQGNESTTSGLVDRASVAETERLQGLADYYAGRDVANQPAELKRLIAQIEAANQAAHPGFNIEKFRIDRAAAAAVATQTNEVSASDVFNLRYLDFVQQMAEEHAASKAAQQANLEQRLAHEFVEEQSSGRVEPRNLIERLAR